MYSGPGGPPEVPVGHSPSGTRGRVSTPFSSRRRETETTVVGQVSPSPGKSNERTLEVPVFYPSLRSNRTLPKSERWGIVVGSSLPRPSIFKFEGSNRGSRGVTPSNNDGPLAASGSKSGTVVWSSPPDGVIVVRSDLQIREGRQDDSPSSHPGVQKDARKQRSSL